METPLNCLRSCKKPVSARHLHHHTFLRRIQTNMGKVQQPTTASNSNTRKRSNAQQSIAAAFKAAKRPHTNPSNAGKADSSSKQQDVDTPIMLDQTHAAKETNPSKTAATDPVNADDGDLQQQQQPSQQQRNVDPQQPHQQPRTEAQSSARKFDVANQTNSNQPATDAAPDTDDVINKTTPNGKPSASPAAAAKQQKPAAAKRRRTGPTTAAGLTNSKLGNKRTAAAAAAKEEEDAVSDADDVESMDDAAAEPSAVADSASFTPSEVEKVQLSLLRWYDRVCRTLPWRRNPHKVTTPATAAAAAAAADKDAAAERTDDTAAAAASSSKKQKKRTKQEIAAAEAAAVLAAATAAPAELSPQEFAYFVWVSEIMLQQTQVSRVITYFNTWISRWPTVFALAAASQEQVNEVWAGLGYYRRARYLLEGAQFIVNKLGGKFPETATELRKIPGVGPYTAAAIGSIAFNDTAAAVDGNVIRVLARMRAVKGNPTSTQMTKVWDKLAAQLLHQERPGCHNQAMMELGATVCKPLNPTCDSCPVSSCCAAFAAVQQYISDGGAADVEDAPKVTDYPEKVTKAAKRDEQVAVCVLKVLLLPGANTAAALTAAATAAAAKDTKPSSVQQQQQQQQRNIRNFFKPKPQDNAADGSNPHQQQQHCESDLLSAGAAAYYLLVQRPDNGLLAGLWEFPGVIMAAEPTPTARRATVDKYLSEKLGVKMPGSGSGSSSEAIAAAAAAGGDDGNVSAKAAAAAVHLVHRRQLGSSVHIFSHIKQTSHAEEMVLLATSLDLVCAAAATTTTSSSSNYEGVKARAAEDGYGVVCAGLEVEKKSASSGAKKSGYTAAADGDEAVAAAAADRPAMRWVRDKDIVQQGLTGGVRKILNLALK